MKHAIVLTGFMGSGKSTVGPLVAERLKRTFIDLDLLIEGIAGRSIGQLFEVGEHEFRWWEQEVLRRLDLTQPIVLATGGGTLIGRWNQLWIAPACPILLEAPLEVVRERLSQGGARPLAPRLDELFAARASTYARLRHRVSTADRSPEDVADEVIALAERWEPTPHREEAQGHELVVRLADEHYPIVIRPAVGASVGQRLGARDPERVALISDDNVARLWGESVRHDLMAARLPTALLTFPHGERNKRLETVADLYDGLAEAGVARGGAVVALGGGVVGDIAGFAAATWMRGVRTLVQVPTSLLAMVDASVGGKCGVDHPRGKNLIGVFRQPDLVLIDPDFLTTLPPAQLAEGMAEIVKHALIGAPELLDRLPTAPSPDADREWWSRLIADAVRVKVEIVERDPLERGDRALLNLGHTFAHAYELLSDYHLSHGEAVAVGLVSAARLSERLGLAEPGLADDVAGVLEALDLPTRWSGARDGAQVWEAMRQDKKRATGGLRFILPRAPGDVIVSEPGAVDRDDVVAVIQAQNG